jgi:hypothetical protein
MVVPGVNFNATIDHPGRLYYIYSDNRYPRFTLIPVAHYADTIF